MMEHINNKNIYVANPLCDSKNDYHRIGGNPPLFFVDKQSDITGYSFYACLSYPFVEDKLISIFILDDYPNLIEHNIYPNCAIKIYLHDKTPESKQSFNTNPNLSYCALSDFILIEEDDNHGHLIKLGGEPQLIQNENYYYQQLQQDGYSFFLQIDEDFYPENLIKGSYPFGYGALYLYYKGSYKQPTEIIAGFWQFG